MPGQDFKLICSTLVVKITKQMTISDDYWWFCATPCLRHSMITPLDVPGVAVDLLCLNHWDWLTIKM